MQEQILTVLSIWAFGVITWAVFKHTGWFYKFCNRIEKNLLRKSFFLHKIWSCYHCQAFHFAWIISFIIGFFLLKENKTLIFTVPLNIIILHLLACKFFESIISTKEPDKIDILKDSSNQLLYNKENEHLESEITNKDPGAEAFYEKYGKEIKMTEGNNGEHRIEEISPKMQQAFQFFNLGAPCPYPGCERLRDQYRKSLENHGGSECSDCDRGTLIRIYIPEVIKLMEQHARKNETEPESANP